VDTFEIIKGEAVRQVNQGDLQTPGFNPIQHTLKEPVLMSTEFQAGSRVTYEMAENTDDLEPGQSSDLECKIYSILGSDTNPIHACINLQVYTGRSTPSLGFTGDLLSFLQARSCDVQVIIQEMLDLVPDQSSKYQNRCLDSRLP
jgi:hypothetical protein